LQALLAAQRLFARPLLLLAPEEFMRRIVFAIACSSIVYTACAVKTSKLGPSGSSGDTGGFTGEGGGVNLDVSATGTGPGGGSPCDSSVNICDDQLKNPTPCDEALSVSDTDAMKAAKAIDLCQVASGTSWGVVSAKWVRANGASATGGDNIGIVKKFGNAISPQGGKAMLVLSSGKARDNNATDKCNSQTCNTTGKGTAPPNFPQDVPNCDGSKEILDDIGLELAIRAPKNAKGYSFNFSFMSFEFAEWVCTKYNDQFIALVTPSPMGSINGNISFDKKKNPVSVNIALFDHCDASTKGSFASFCKTLGGNCPAPPNPYCPNGEAFIKGTGFGMQEWQADAGSTGWLATTAPVTGGQQFTIRFAIWDTGDANLDSTVTIDNFRWSGDPVGVGTDPVPNPK
jgi:hypothetical protein